MAGTPDSRRPGQGFDSPPDERTKRIDVIGNAETVIFPSLVDIFRIKQRTVTMGQSDWEAAEAQICADYRAELRNRIVEPLWGSLPRLNPSLVVGHERDDLVIRKKRNRNIRRIYGK